MSKSKRELRAAAEQIVRQANEVNVIGESVEAEKDLAPGLYVTVIWKQVRAKVAA
jgi:hypothetical protein